MSDSLPEVEDSETSETKPGGKSSIWEKKIVLLFAGFLLSGVLVPFIQYTYEQIKWRRQARYDETNFRIGKMREALQELSGLQSICSEASSRYDAFFRSNMTAVAFHEKFQEIQQRRFQSAGKFSSALIYFSPASELSEAYESYLRSTEAYMAGLAGAGAYGQSLTGEARVELHRVDARFQKVQDSYEVLVVMLREELQKVYDEQHSYF